MSKNQLEQSLVEVIGDSQALDLAADISEQTLDALLDEGLFKNIPIFGHLLKLWRTGIDVKNYLFIRKLSKFFGILSTIPQAEREEFEKQIDQDSKFKIRVVNICYF